MANPTGTSKTTQQLTPETFTPVGGSAAGIDYNVTMHQYPNDVGFSRYPHHMVFFINVRDKSKYQGSDGKRVAVKPVTTEISGTDVPKEIFQAVGAAAGAALGASIGGLLFGNLAKTSVASKRAGKGKLVELGGRALTTGGGAVLGYEAADWVNDKLGLFVPEQSYRISDAIMLAVTEKPSVKYGVDYDGKDLGTLVGALGQGSFSDMLEGQRGNELARVLALQAAKLPQGIANVLGADFALSDALQYSTGRAPNPFREQVFRNVENRTFRFDYKFLPQDELEADQVKNIIHRFKLHMHPELTSGKLFYIYPSTFDIAYYFNGKENNNIHKISTCVLERMSVDYGGQTWNTFNDGMPTEINISLEFRELERLTKERIDKLGF